MYYGYPDKESLREAVVRKAKNILGEDTKICTDVFNCKELLDYSDLNLLVDRIVLDTQYWNGDY